MYRREKRNGTESQSAEGSQQQNIGMTRESSSVFLKCFVDNIVLRHFVSVSKKYPPGLLVSTSLLLNIYMEIQKKKKDITYTVCHCKIVLCLPSASS